MTWSLRFTLIASLLFLLAWLGLEHWHRVLASLVSGLLPLFSYRFEISRLDLLAPYDLAFFLAMTLTTRASWRERCRAIALGVPMLVAAEVVFALVDALGVLREASGRPLPSALTTVGNGIASSFPWIAAPLAWVVLLGDTVRRGGAIPPRRHDESSRRSGRTRRRRKLTALADPPLSVRF